LNGMSEEKPRQDIEEAIAAGNLGHLLRISGMFLEIDHHREEEIQGSYGQTQAS